MKYALFLVLLAAFTVSTFSQSERSSKKSSSADTAIKAPAGKPTPKPIVKKDEKTELEAAMAQEEPEKKASALSKFLSDFPNTEHRSQVIESLTVARVAAAQSKLEAGDREAASKFARKALEEAPVPYPEKLFSESISKIPLLIFSLEGSAAAHEIAAVIEKNSASSLPQLLSLAGFYLGLENGSEGRRLAEAALKLDEKSVAAYQALGMANRLNFDLEAAAAAYEKAAELDPESMAARYNLAEMKRAIGKPDEAVTLFTSLIEKDPNDLRPVNGRILSLFDAGKRTEAESELAKTVEAEPGNFLLLAGAAYWYAANGEPKKAIDLGGKALAAEPRYIWSHIALARGLAGDARPMDAEQVLLKARKYGNFPTLDFELAAVKFASGFFREAADELQKSFTIRNGAVVTKLGRRIERSSKNFIDLVADERRASIMVARSADRLDIAERMKALLEFTGVLVEKTPDEAKASEAASAFASGTDRMRFHRQIYAANQLAERSLAPAKVLELAKAAVASVDDGLTVDVPSAPIMASELYASRVAAVAADKYVIVPEVPKQTLSVIARGRIEEVAGAALLQQKNYAEAIIRFRRAVGILPEKSAWWRNSYWRLGTAFEADGQDKEALDAYVKSYISGEPEAEKYARVESVYKRVNNGTDGLDALIGANPSKPADKAPEGGTPTLPDTKAEAGSAINAADTPEIKPGSTTEKKAETVSDKAAEPSPMPARESRVPEVSGSPSPAAEPEAKKVTEEKRSDQNPPLTEKPSPPPADLSRSLEAKPPVDAEPSSKPNDDLQKTTETKPEVKVEPAPPPSPVKDRRPDSEKIAETKPAAKPLFEPVVISVRNDKVSSAKAETAPAEPIDTDKPNKADERSGATRPRVVVTNALEPTARTSCTLSVSQDNISLVAGSGSIGVLVGVDNGEIKDVKFASSSPSDVEVTAEPEIAGVSGRALFIIRSLTAASGTYKVEFTSPCGKKEVYVRVR